MEAPKGREREADGTGVPVTAPQRPVEAHQSANGRQRPKAAPPARRTRSQRLPEAWDDREGGGDTQEPVRPNLNVQDAHDPTPNGPSVKLKAWTSAAQGYDMPPIIFRRLDPAAALNAVSELMMACDDYTRMMRGTPADLSDGATFLAAAPPGRDTANVRKLGAFTGDDRNDGGSGGTQGQLVAVADVVPNHPAGGTWFVGLLLVRPEWHGRGTGARFIEHIEALARGAGAERVELLVLAENTHALRFWERAGFTVAGRREAIGIGERTHERFELTKVIDRDP